MSEEKKKNWFEKNQELGNRARELTRRLKEGDSGKLKENLNELKALRYASYWHLTPQNAYNRRKSKNARNRNSPG